MSTSGRQQEKNRKSSGISLHNHDEESAARTRPLSFEEIMLRRGYKMLRDNVIEEVVDVGNIPRDSVVRNVSDPLESERGSRQQEGLLPAVQKPISPETVKQSSRKKETCTDKEDDFSTAKVRGGHESESLKDKQHRNTRTEAKGDLLESERGSRQHKDRPPAEKPISQETVKESSRKKDTCNTNSSTKRKDDVSKEKVRGGHESESLKDERHRSTRTEAKGADPLESERFSTQHKGFPPLVEKPISEEPVKANSRKKETYDFKSTKKEEDLAKEKGRGGNELKSLKDELHANARTEAKERKTEKQLQGRRKIDDYSSDKFQSDAVKKRSRELAGKDRHVNQSRGNTERESKRKHQNGDDDKIRDRNAAKKHDPGKHRVLEISERKKRKESSKSRFGESRLKRGRSRSREHEDRHRFRTRSPMAQKYTTHKLGIRSEISLRSLKDRSERQHSDIERSRISNNGSSSHYRGHGGLTNRLGGYSPRKRRTESALKTPSPPDRSPEKKSARWDDPPTTDKVLSGSIDSLINSANGNKSSNVHEMAIAVAVPSDTRKSISVSPLSFSPKNSASTDSVQSTQATRPMRRLYVENVPCSTSEDTLVESLNNYLLSTGVNHIQGIRPCISCVINREKGQAVAEFLTPEDALAALSFDGSDLSGSILKIRRPRDSVEVATGDPEKSMAIDETISDVVKDSPDKIFIGGFSKDISSKMLMEIISVFGPLKAYHFEVNEELDEPCAFVEYMDQSVTHKACAGLNGMKLGGRVLTAVQAIRDASSLENTGKTPLYKIPEYAKPLLKEPSQVLMLRNVFNVENISSSSEPEIQEVLEDVRLECARFGTVKSIKLVKHCNDHIATTGASEAVNHAESGGWQHFEPKEDTAKTNTWEEHIGNDSKETSGAEFPIAKEVKEDVVTEGNWCNSDKPADEFIEVNSCQMGKLDANIAIQGSQNQSDMVSEELPNQLNNMQDVPECYDNMTTEAIETENLSLENKLMAEERLPLEEADGGKEETFAGKDGSEGAESDATEKSQIKEQDHAKEHDYDRGSIFGPGCVLVEFGRTEPSLMAAHCLHGRVFEDRIVTVEYIALDHYRAQFPH